MHVGGKRYPRINPMLHYNEERFIERYQISMEVVHHNANYDFAISRICSPKFYSRGCGLSVEERVSNSLIIPSCPPFLYMTPKLSLPQEIIYINSNDVTLNPMKNTYQNCRFAHKGRTIH